jgi:hypothetical protein
MKIVVIGGCSTSNPARHRRRQAASLNVLLPLQQTGQARIGLTRADSPTFSQQRCG